MPHPTRTALVVSAHAADFVWRAGGAIALHAARGFDVTVVCLSLGERGESASSWKRPGATLERVKAQRMEEAEAAAAVLGARLRFFDLGDYPMRVPDQVVYDLADVYRELRPAFVLTHALRDPYNFDHPLASHLAQEARIVAQAHGRNSGQGDVLGAPPVYLFEPHQPEQCEWRPDTFLDITESGNASGPHSRRWRRRSTSGTTTRVSRFSEGCRPRGTPTWR